MTAKQYDSRSRAEILSAAHFAPYLDAPRLAEIDIRALRRLDRFFAYAEKTGVTLPSVADFLRFAEGTRSTRQLEDLRAAFDRLLPEGSAVQQTIREAIRAKRPRSRVCDRRTREVILAEPHLKPYRALPGMAAVRIEDLRVLERFLRFAAERRIQVPATADYLAFAEGAASSRSLRSLKTALALLLPGNPGVLLILAEAIAAKTPAAPAKPGKPRAPAERRVPRDRLPLEWQHLLGRMRAKESIGRRRPPAPSRIASMEDVLREYARTQLDAGLPMTLSIEGVRCLESARDRYAAARDNPAYGNQGNRPSTRHTAAMRLRQFAEYLAADPALITALRAHERRLRQETARVVPLKFGKLDRLPALSEIWDIARTRLTESKAAERRQTGLRLLNEAVILALWILLPLRLEDSRLRWGRDVYFDGARYRVDIETHKEREPLRARLHAALTPFLDALILNGMDAAYLAQMRARAMSGELPLFVTTSGRQLSKGYPSAVWRKQFGAGAHLLRTRLHTELGRLGPEGVEAALALCAQRDPRTAAFYHADSVGRAHRKRGQDMIEDQLAAVFAETDPVG